MPEESPAPPRESSPSDAVLDYTGRTIHVVPYEGWGWGVYDTDDWVTVESVEMRAPFKFEMNVVRFFDWNGRRRGGIGSVATDECKFHNMWTLFYTYNEAGVFDFDSNLARHWIHIGSTCPKLFPMDHEPSGKYWPLPSFGDCRRYSGMAVLAASAEDAERELNF